METPDKIYVPIVNLGIEEGEHPAPLWWNKDKKSEHPDVVGTIAYIRKEAILGFLGEVSIAVNSFTHTFANDIRAEGANKIISLIKEHIESL